MGRGEGKFTQLEGNVWKKLNCHLPSNSRHDSKPSGGFQMPAIPYDPRAICNLVLDEAAELGQEISHVALQKLLYFAHSLYLIENKAPLVSGYFEAWQYGPVHPGAYPAFKPAGNRPIWFRAHKTNPLNGAESEIPRPSSVGALRVVRRVLLTYGDMSPSQLIELSHAKEAPWDFVVREAQNKMAFGMRIGDNVILDRFKHHKISLGTDLNAGELLEDSPFA
jgi:uncharacterized phage-associated protein